ncbi:hypothetical protein SprV_0602043000 [Sparganum proliferum]
MAVPTNPPTPDPVSCPRSFEITAWISLHDAENSLKPGPPMGTQSIDLSIWRRRMEPCVVTSSLTPSVDD